MAMNLIGGGGPPGGPPMGPPGPAGPPGPGGGGMDLAALLGAGGGGPEGLPGGEEPAPQQMSEPEALDAILQAIDDYMQIPTVNEQERLLMEECSTRVQKLKAQNESMADEVSGGNPAVRKALGTPAGGY